MNRENDTFQAMREESRALPGAAVLTGRFNRRCAVRFSIEQDVRYKVFTRNTIEVGFGKTVNMSSNGVLFTTERPLALGARLVVAVNWPALLDNKCALKLVTTGRVVRRRAAWLPSRSSGTSFARRPFAAWSEARWSTAETGFCPRL